MTKNIFQLVGILFLIAVEVMAAPAERWIHVRVESARGGSANIIMNVPIEMASAVLSSIPAEQQHHGKFNFEASVNGMELRAVLEAVRKSPDNVFVSLERHDRQVRVAKSGQNLLIKVARKPGAGHDGGETVDIKVPIPVVRAMLAGNSDRLDVGAGIRALIRQGDVDVTVNNDKEMVRVWTDTRTATD